MGVSATDLVLGDGKCLPSNFVVGAAGATPHEWVKNTDLKLVDGFIKIDETLQTSSSAVFAMEDCAHMSFDPRPMAGVFAVLSLVDFTILTKTWGYSKSDFTAVAATILLTLSMGVEVGVASGVIISVLLHLYKTSQPHVAEVGLVPDTQHFRNINRHKVETDPKVVTLRLDESLYFINARFLDEMVQSRVTEGCEIKHVILMFSAVNEVDYSALESLEAINLRLEDMNVGLNLSEVKGPVMDRLKQSHLLDYLHGQVFLSQFDAWRVLAKSGRLKPAAE